MKNKAMKIEELLPSVTLANETFTRKNEIWNRIAVVLSMNKNQNRNIWLHKPVIWSVAASLAIFVLLSVGYQKAGVEYLAQAETMSVTLPQGSEVELYPNSSLRYNRWIFKINRQAQLAGEAFFNVTAGNEFTVTTAAGKISVLGTKFHVQQNEANLKVECFEGSVKVAASAGKQVLGAGEYVQYDEEGMHFGEIKSEWPEVISFDEEPLSQVIAKMEEIFQVEISPKQLCDGISYSGIVLTDDLDSSLEMVFGSCGIGYKTDRKKVVLQNEFIR